ncbi:hypothetical protein ACJJID_07390 [Microbulbifer sp. CnH-101-G]|uniref:hypothetical protein n=1 Tax=Microbulbifer sp. CnH-101-G TaxID=3243393 RepID=UPI0040399450
MYQPSKAEKIARGLMLGLVPITFLIFIYVGFFALVTRGTTYTGVIGGLFFASHEETFFCILTIVYIVSAIFGYFKGWEGYSKVFSLLGKWLDYTGGIVVDPGAKVLTPRDRVRKMHNNHK